MNNQKKHIILFLICSSVVTIILVGFLIFKTTKNEVRKSDNKINRTKFTPPQLKGTDRIPKTAFWIKNNGNGNWFNIDWIHDHRNNAIISIYDKSGQLLVKSKFMKICPADELKLIEDLEKEIDFYDGKDIQLKDNCYLLKNCVQQNL